MTTRLRTRLVLLDAFDTLVRHIPLICSSLLAPRLPFLSSLALRSRPDSLSTSSTPKRLGLPVYPLLPSRSRQLLSRVRPFPRLARPPQLERADVGNAAFPAINKQYPLYGAADGMSAEKWWTILIEDTMKEAGADPSRLSFSLLLASFQGFRRAKAFDKYNFCVYRNGASHADARFPPDSPIRFLGRISSVRRCKACSFVVPFLSLFSSPPVTDLFSLLPLSVEAFRSMGVKTAVLSNADSRIRSCLFLHVPVPLTCQS
jgi:hypothetical protein